MFTYVESLPVVQAPLLGLESWLLHGFGIRDIAVEKYLEAFGVSNASVPLTKQTHGNRIHILSSKVPGPWSLVPGPVLEGDAFITDASNMVCWVRTADCVPILVADCKHHMIGAVHAGWRGTAEKILLKTLEKMTEEWGTKAGDLRVALGPAIGGHCYQVGLDVIQTFEKAGLFPGPWIEESRKDKWYLDIAFANLRLLEQAGVLREQVYLSLACTACDLEKFASYRKEKDKRGEQVSFILKRDQGL